MMLPETKNDGDTSHYESASRHGYLQASGRRLVRIDTSRRRLRFKLPVMVGSDSGVCSATTVFKYLQTNSCARTHFFMVLSKLPDYFEEKGWKNPDYAYDGPFQYALNTKSTYFELLATKPYLQQAFNTVMTLSHRRRGQQWFNSFPIESKLLVHSSSDPLLIDIGGSQGADLISFKERYPDLSGWLILQDLPIVVEQAKNVPFGIEVMGYDFFAPQPIKGAKAYYLRTVLHDWPDQRAVQILQRVREAMGPESLLLINEIVLPETNVALSSALADLTMMVSFSSLERTQKQFEALLNEAGFELVHLRTPDGFESRSAPLAEQASLLEAVPKRP